MRKIRQVLLCLLLVVVSVANAQNKTISGQVTSERDGEPMPGVSILVKGTSNGAISDNDGNFEITVANKGAVLVFSFIGMEKKEVSVGSATTLTVALKSTALSMDEVLVVGYGTTTKEAKTGAAFQVDGEAMEDVPTTSVEKTLSGRVAGVSVSGSSGQPGAITNIRIRGTSSINAGNEPLYVVDGVPVMNDDQSYFTNTSNALSIINPSDIESVTVLKDASAASIYGSRAANGVILITTKQGKEGKSTITARASYGFENLANDNDYRTMSPQELLEYQRTAVINAGYNPDDPSTANVNAGYYLPMEILSRPQTNWIDEFLQKGQIQNYEITASGGTEKTKIYSSIAYNTHEGVAKGVEFDRIMFNIKADHKFNDVFSMGSKINGGYMESKDIAMQSLYYSNPFWAGMNILPWTPFLNEDGTDYNDNITENSGSNPLLTAKYEEQSSKQYRFNGNIYLTAEPIKNLILKTSNSAEMTTGEGRRYWDYRAGNSTSTLQASTAQYRQLTTSNTASYAKTLGSSHNLNFMAGQEAIAYDYYSYYIYSPEVNAEIPYPTTSTAEKDEGSYGNTAWTLLSFFGTADYNYDSKYYFSSSLRYDGSSRFGDDNKWGMFYSLGASWNISEESFLEDVDAVNFLKLRASYGTNGNNSIGDYSQYGLYGSTSYNGVSAMLASSPENSTLAWEKNIATNIGVDFTVFHNLSGNIDIYKRNTSEMLLSNPLSQTSGFSSIRQNIGELENRGIEFQLDYKVDINDELSLNIGGNISANKTEVISLANGQDKIGTSTVTAVGEQLMVYHLFDYAGVDPSNGLALWRDEDGAYTTDYNKAARINTGKSPEPKLTGGAYLNATWKGITLDCLFEYKYGSYMVNNENRYLVSDGYSWGTNQSAQALDYWKQPGDITSTPKPIANNTTSSSAFASTRWLERADYVRIKSVTLSYSLPKSINEKILMKNTKVYVSGLNLFTFHDVNHWDPERGISGWEYGIYPMTKTIVFGLDLTF